MITRDDYKERQDNKAKHQMFQKWHSLGDIGIDAMDIAQEVLSKVASFDHLSSRKVMAEYPTADKLEQFIRVAMASIVRVVAAEHNDKKARGASTTTVDRLGAHAMVTLQVMFKIFPIMYKMEVTNNPDMSQADAEEKFTKTWMEFENRINGYKLEIQPSFAVVQHNKLLGKKTTYGKKGFAEWSMHEGVTVNINMTIASLVREALESRGILTPSIMVTGKGNVPVVKFAESFLKTKKGEAAAKSEYVIANGVFENSNPPEIDEDFSLGFHADVTGKKVVVVSRNDDRGDTTVIVKALNHLQKTRMTHCDKYAVIEKDIKAIIALAKKNK